MPKNVTLRQIAEACGVSSKTVSYILTDRPGASVSEQTRHRVLQASRQLGYTRNGLAAALRKGRMNTIGIVSPFDLDQATDTGRYVYAKNLMYAITIAAAREKLNTTFFVDNAVTGVAPAELADRRVDGVILLDLYDHEAWVRAIYATELPCIEIGSCFGPYHVTTDNRNAARAATEHLIGLGHRRIGHWYGGDSPIPAESRKEGFLDALRAAQLPEEESVVFHTEVELAALLRQPNRPTALFLYNDEYAERALDGVVAAGLRVPRDISLVGFDDDLRAISMRPKLTTVSLPLDAMARAAIRLMTAQLAGATLQETQAVLSAPLIIRESTCAYSDQ